MQSTSLRTRLLSLLLLIVGWPQTILADTPPATTTIDVLVVYPRPAEQHLSMLISWGRNFGETEMDAFLTTDFAHVTQIYQRSGIEVAFNVIHHEAIDLSYIDAANWKVTLSSALMNSENQLPAHLPYLEAIENLRNLHGADIVIYWREHGDGGPSSNGAGSIGGGDDEAYVQLTYGGVNPPITAHEIGHLLGGQHSDGVQGSASFSIAGDTPTLREYRTVMTIAVPLGLDAYRYLWRFSANGATVVGDHDCSPLSGSLETCSFAAAVGVGDPSHDAVSVLSATAVTVAAFRDAPPPEDLPVFGGTGLMLLILASARVVLRGEG